MADPQNFNFFQAMTNPQFAGQQLQIQRQQALAQQLMDQGSEQPPMAQLANPGGMVIKNSPVAALARALEKGVGGYISGKALAAQMQSYQDLHDQQVRGADPMASATDAAIGSGEGPATAQSVGQKLGQVMSGNGISTQPNMSELSLLGYDPTGKLSEAAFKTRMELQNAGPIKQAQEQQTYHATPEGDYKLPVAQSLSPQPTQTTLPVPQPSSAMPPPPAGITPAIPMSEGNNAKLDNLFGSGQEVSTAAKIPNAGDGKPVLSGISNIPTPDPKGLPSYGTPNTNSGVNLNKQMTDADVKANGAFANESQSLSQEKSRITNLINAYQQVKGGSLTAQDPEFFQKMAAAGFTDSPEQLKTLAGVQNATQNHILQIVGQLKDSNANLEGGQASRQFASTMNALLEKGESAKDQPEALWNILAQAQGQVDHHLDMIDAYQKVGGMGNRLNNGVTMPADTFATKFTLDHPIDNYVEKAKSTIPPFMGMAGNSGKSQLPHGITAQDIQAEMARRSGK